jgi:hypothetical protein
MRAFAQYNPASAQAPVSCDATLQGYAGDAQLLELRLSNGDKLRGRIVRATDSNVSLESNKKDKSTREIPCSQIEAYSVRRNSHWVRWTIIGVAIMVGVESVLMAVAF